MELQHINVKIFVEDPRALDLHAFNPIFQTWIRQRVTDEVLIDVADYLHVPEGPGMVLIGLEADYALDNTDGRWGLKYNRKASVGGKNTDRIRQALKAALSACERLEKEPRLNNKIKFVTTEFQVFVNDRALAPNVPKTWPQCEKDFREVFSKVLGENSLRFELVKNPRSLFGFHVYSKNSQSMQDLIKRLS